MPAKLSLGAFPGRGIKAFFSETVEKFELLWILGPTIFILFDLLLPKILRQKSRRRVFAGKSECAFRDAQPRDLEWMRADRFLREVAADFDVARLVVGERRPLFADTHIGTIGHDTLFVTALDP